MLIGTNYKIESDALNFILYKKMKHKRNSIDYWKAIAYFSTVANALDYLVDLEVAETGLTDLRTVVKKQAELYELIRSIPLPVEIP